MARIVILGSAAAVNDADHDYTHFLLIGEQDSPILVDAGSNPLGKIKNLGFTDDAVQDIIFTHFHPDHVSGLPNMMMHMWLQGRTAPMRIYGLHHCINRIEDMMAAFDWATWPNFFPVTFHRVTERDNTFLMENKDFIIHSWPVKHFVPTIGLRIYNKNNGKIFAYSCDTMPIPTLPDLAYQADILLHEAAGEGFGHSSAKQAGEIASEAGAKSLYLIHYHVWNQDPTPLPEEAAETYEGPIHLCKDGDIIEF
ncbi:MAG: MBL fold metallo-hydrolase [Chloroflexi bacterium]|nr:MAG: MBL fold metallo-hydrolase [Chloroflexota bacterium]